MAHLLLVPSPLLGPAVWQPVAAWLRERGRSAGVVEFGRERTTPETVLTWAIRAGDGLSDVVLVPHSNAGLYVPRLGELLDVTGTVYVDAALAGDELDTALAAPEFLEKLRTLTDPDGVLPPWTQWWDDVDKLFPNAASRAAVEAEQRRLPLAYFNARLPVPTGWAERPTGYLAFGETYAAERAFAVDHGWPVATLDGGHLHMLLDPAAVGASILALLDRVLHE